MLGKSLTKNTRQLLSWCGVDDTQVSKWSLESLQQKDILDFTQPKKKTKIKFDDHKLPEDAELLDQNNP